MNLPQQPLVSIDTVPLVLRDGHWRVILGVRELEPYAGQAALPGVLITEFYGGFHFWVTLVGLAIQLLLVARIYRAVGVRGG